MAGKRRKLFVACLCCFPLALSLFGENVPPEPGLPLPSATRLAWVAHATGFQIYKAEATAESPGPLRWVFQEPEATLRDPAGARIGSHFRGPCWEAVDGSRIAGSGPPLVQTPARSPSNIPWLLIAVHSTGTAGALDSVSHVLRVDTLGGTAPAKPPSRAGETVRVPYKATYLFLAPVAVSTPSPR